MKTSVGRFIYFYFHSSGSFSRIESVKKEVDDDQDTEWSADYYSDNFQ